MTPCGVYIDGERPRTKRDIRRALQDDPYIVLIEDVDSSGLAPEIGADEISEGQEIEVCGPDPYTERKWTATIVRANGRVIVR